MSDKPLICVPIVETKLDAVLEKVREICEEPIQMIEWRIDYLEELKDTKAVLETAADVKHLLEKRSLISDEIALLITWRTQFEGGEYISCQDQYEETIKAIVEADVCNYVDVEMERELEDLDGILATAKKNKIKVIGSYHNFDYTPEKEKITDRLLKMKEMGFSVGKVAVMPKCREDVEDLLFATEEATKKEPDFPVITMSMGEVGQVSRLYGWLYGSRVTFACHGKASAPGQVEVGQVTEALKLADAEKKHVVLIGFMGTGKSTVSSLVKKKLSYLEIDTDAYIEEIEGRAIKDIFAEDGEEVFRQMETAIIDRLAEMGKSVVSCGGGMAMRDINVKKLKRVGTICLLTATPETIYDRVKDSTNRPLLNGNMNVRYIAELMGKRKPFYEKAADLVFATDSLTPEQVAEKICEKYT